MEKYGEGNLPFPILFLPTKVGKNMLRYTEKGFIRESGKTLGK